MSFVNVRSNEFTAEKLFISGMYADFAIPTLEKLGKENGFNVQRYTNSYGDSVDIHAEEGGTFKAKVDREGNATVKIYFKRKYVYDFRTNKFLMFMFYLIRKFKMTGFIDIDWEGERYKLHVSEGSIKKHVDIIDRTNDEKYAYYENPYLENHLKHIELTYKINNKLEELHNCKNENDKFYITKELERLAKKKSRLIVFEEVV